MLPRSALAPSLQVALGVAVAGVLFLGVFPGVLLEPAQYSALTLLVGSGGVAAVGP